MLNTKDTYNTNITETLVDLLSDNITGFREVDWWSKSKRYGKSIDIKTIKYELCVLVSDAYFGHELKHRDDALYYSIHYERAKRLLGKNYRKYLDLVFRCKGGVKISAWNSKDGSTLRWKLKDEVIELCDKAYKKNTGIRRLVDRKGSVMKSWVGYAVSKYNEKAEKSKKVDTTAYQNIEETILLNKINCTLATHMFSDIYKYKTGRIKESEVSKWYDILDKIGADINDDERFGLDRLKELHLRTIEMWGQLNIDIIGDGRLAVMYKERNTGRLYTIGYGGLQNIQRELRTMLLSGLGYFDYDMENAHYTILGQYYKMISNRSLPAVSKYISNTDATRTQISKDTGIRKDLVKKCLLGIIYGAKINSKRKVVNGKHQDTAIYKTIYGQTKDAKVADYMFDRFSKNTDIVEIWRDVDIAYRYIKNNWKIVSYKGGNKERMANMNGNTTYTKELKPDGTYQYKSKGQLLSHFLQGIEARILKDIILEEGNSFRLAIHDGWVSYINWDVADIERRISQHTRKHLLNYSGIQRAFEIKIKKKELKEIVSGDWIDTLIKDGVLEEIG